MSVQALPKAQRTQGLSYLTTAFKQHKNSTLNLFKTSASKSWSNSASVPDQNSDSKYRPKLQLQNIDQNSDSKSWRKICFKILIKLLFQYPDKYSG